MLSFAQVSRTRDEFHRALFLRLLGLSLLFLAGASAARAQSPAPGNDQATQNAPAPSASKTTATEPTDSLSGTVLDPRDVGLPGAKIRLSRPDQSAQETVSDEDGRFFFANIAPGPYQLAVSCVGFATNRTSGLLAPGESEVLPPITLALATNLTEIRVGIPPIEVAAEQIHAEEQQRALGFIPNFYVSYVPNAVPLNAKQKFNLAWKSTLDPVSFGLNAASAGIQQATNEFGGYGQGAEGYAKRYGATYADFVIGTYIGSAILPSLLKQDPRYFYKGSGSRKSRVGYAIANAVICKGDNGRWQPNYSGIGGSLAAGGISNLYYPAAEHGASLVFENTLIGVGTTAAANLLQEFVIRKLTPNLPSHTQANP